MAKGSLFTGRDTDKATQSFISFLTRSGIPKEAYYISRSVTDFGKSNYFKFLKGGEGNDSLMVIETVRVSDHSVGQRRVFDELSYSVISTDKQARDRFLNIVRSYLKNK